MRIKSEYAGMDGAGAWKMVVEYVKANGSFSSVTGIPYYAVFVGNCIFLKGGQSGTKRSSEGEYLTGKDFMAAYDAARNLEDINTGRIKPYIKRQQTPFMGLLFSAGIIE